MERRHVCVHEIMRSSISCVETTNAVMNIVHSVTVQIPVQRSRNSSMHWPIPAMATSSKSVRALIYGMQLSQHQGPTVGIMIIVTTPFEQTKTTSLYGSDPSTKCCLICLPPCVEPPLLLTPLQWQTFPSHLWHRRQEYRCHRHDYRATSRYCD